MLTHELEIIQKMIRIRYNSREDYRANKSSISYIWGNLRLAQDTNVTFKCTPEIVDENPTPDPSIDPMPDPGVEPTPDPSVEPTPDPSADPDNGITEPEVEMWSRWIYKDESGYRTHTNIYVDVKAQPGAKVTVSLSKRKWEGETMVESVILDESGQTRITFKVYAIDEYTAVVEIDGWTIEKKIIT